ncbi:MAG: threonine synthase [Thermoprotei archaeon]|nr:MAG: threonine synthase [Thermoprotei archaeon]
MRYRLVCLKCGSTLVPNTWVYRHSCGSPLRIELNLNSVEIDVSEIRRREWSMWRYRELIPARKVVSLGEGFTPLLERDFFALRLYLKLEYLNPTGSFKDRGTAVTISKVSELKIRGVIEDSSGNAGISVAYYSSAAGIKAKIYVPRDAPPGKKALILSSGATLVECSSRTEAHKRAIKDSESSEYAYVGHLWNPYFIEGTKTMAFEVAEQLGWRAPSIAVVPVASGTLLLGLYKGFRELYELKLIDKVPKLIAVQGAGCAPVYKAIHGEESCGSSALADGLRVENPPRLEEIIRAIRETRGDCIVVDDYDIHVLSAFAFKKGFIVEPTSVAALAGVRKAVEEGLIDKGEEVLVPLTGSGLKYITAA